MSSAERLSFPGLRFNFLLCEMGMVTASPFRGRCEGHVSDAVFGAEFSQEQTGDKDAGDPGSAVGWGGGWGLEVGEARQGKQRWGLNGTAIRAGLRSSGSR